MVRISKVINNNMVSVKSDTGGEILLGGTGIGFGKRPGDELDASKVERKYVLEDASLVRRFNEISIDIDSSVIDVVFDAVERVKKQCPREISNSLYVLLADHVYNLIERIDMGISFDGAALWNLRSLYPEEYEMALGVIAMLRERLPYPIDDVEASFVTLHIINAELNDDMSETMRYTTYIEDVRDIVSSCLGVDLEEGSYRVNRFLMHLRYLFARLGKGPEPEVASDTSLGELVAQRHPIANDAVEKVSTYIEASTGSELSPEERTYLLVHIVQIFNGGLSSAAQMSSAPQEG